MNNLVFTARPLAAAAIGLASIAFNTSAAAQASDQAAATTPSSALRIAIDPDTHQPRPVEHQDLQRTATMVQQAARGALAPQDTMKRLAPMRSDVLYSGATAHGRVLDPSRLRFSVIRVEKDGAVDQTCGPGTSGLQRWANARTQAKRGGGDAE